MQIPITPEALVPAGAGLLAVAILLFVLLTRGWRPVAATEHTPSAMHVAETATLAEQPPAARTPQPTPRAADVAGSGSRPELGPRADPTLPKRQRRLDRTDARDRLLGVLLADPGLALEAMDELTACGGQLARLDEAVRYQRGVHSTTMRRLLDAGLDPDQVATLAGVAADEVRDLLPQRTASRVGS